MEHMVIPAGHLVYTEIDMMLGDAEYETPIVVTQYHGPDVPNEGPADLHDAIDEQILAGLVCL